MKEVSLDRFNSETEEFYQKHPDVDLDTVGKDVWKRVENGENLSSVYSEVSENQKNIQKKNMQNRAASFGGVGSPLRQAGVYNSRDVEKMSRETVRREYDNIIKSMKSKGFFS